MSDKLYEKTRHTNRPFLMINIIQRPADGVRTDERGWSKVTGSWSMFERVEIVDRVRRKDYTTASVIIDVVHGKVVKTRVDHPEEEIVEYYLGKYKDECKKAVEIWIQKHARHFLANDGKRILAEQAAIESTEAQAPSAPEAP